MKLIVEIPKPANMLDFVVFDPVEAGESWTDVIPGITGRKPWRYISTAKSCLTVYYLS